MTAFELLKDMWHQTSTAASTDVRWVPTERAASTTVSRMGETDDLRRLAHAVTERRRALGLTRAEVKDRGGPADTTLARIEQPTETTAPPRPSTLRRIDAGLDWPAGTAAGLLVGASGQSSQQSPDGALNLADALSFTNVSMPVDIIRELVRVADSILVDLGDLGMAPPSVDDLRRVVQRLTAVYATEVLERVGGPGAQIPPAIEVPFRPHLTALLSDDPAVRRDQLYRRWLAGATLSATDRHLLPDFEARWRAKRRDIMLRESM